MARTYNQQTYQGGYEGHHRGQQYSPVRAFDNSEQFKAIARQRVADAQTMGRQAAAQYEIDKTALNIQKEQGLMSMKLQQQATANGFNALKGLLGLSQTAMSTFKKLEEEKAVRDEEDTILESVGWGEVPVAETEAAAAETAQADAMVQADAQGRSQVAAELQQQPGVNNQSAAHALQQTSLYNSLKDINGNAYTAMAQHNTFLQSAVQSMQDGAKTPAQAQVMLRELNRQFLRNSGMLNAPRQLQVKLARVMAANTQNTVTSLVTASIKMEQANNLSEAQNFVSSLADSGSTAQEIWKQSSERYANGNLGYTGYSRASNQAALENILQEYANNGDTAAIKRLREVEMIPGNKGTKLTSQFDHLFDKYEKAARTGAIQDYNLKEAEGKVEMKKSIQDYYDAPTPENRAKAIETLRFIGTEDALTEANRLAANGLNYDPQKKFDLLQMQQSGQEIPQDMLKGLLDNGTINATEYKQFAVTSADAQSVATVDEFLKGMGTGLKVSMQGQASATDLSPAVRAQLNVRYEAFEDDLRRSILAEVKLNPGIANDKTELARIVEQKSQYLLQQPQYKLHRDTTKNQWVFAGDMNAGKNLASITVSPGVQDFTSLTPDQITKGLKVPRSEMDPTKDRFLDEYQLKTDVNAVLKGEPTSARTNVLAKMLGLSPQAFIQSQMDVMGLPSLRSMKREQEQPQQVSSTTFDIKSAPEGMKLLEQEFGFPRLGAAYLAGNIQQESGWHGLRQWGQVAGDGTNRNGGLVSWASWANDSARLGAIERYYGKNIAQISEIDQLKYMVHEMKRRNPDSYRTFMNPNASEAALRRASYQYWGFGHEGGRYAYANNLLKYGRL